VHPRAGTERDADRQQGRHGRDAPVRRADHGIRSTVERHPFSAVNEVLGKLRDGKVRLRAVLTP